MNFHEFKKDSKIVDEILLYLLKEKCSDISINVKRNDEGITFIFKTAKLDQKIISYMDKYINQEREIEVEEYGWELMGESDSQSDLGMVGLLIDKLIVDDSDLNFTILKLVRNYQKK